MRKIGLISRVIEYGADAEGIRDRFADNEELYASCLKDFFEDEDFSILERTIAEADYQNAFKAAHALKGFAGNLGLTAIYEPVCELTEALRMKKYENADKYCKIIMSEFNRLKRFIDGKEHAESFDKNSESEAARKKKKETNGRLKKFVIGSIAFIAALLTAVLVLFGRMNISYQKNMRMGSSVHLGEMSNQLKLYVEEQIALDWNTVRSVGDGVAHGEYGNDDEYIYNLLDRRKQIWGVSDLMLYTENGYCFYSDGTTETNDIGSRNCAMARKYGKYMSIIESGIIYTVPIETELEFNGSRIVAASVVRDMESFLDDMNFSSFSDNAWIVLTDSQGIIISSLTNDNTITAFNFTAITESRNLTPLDENLTVDELLTKQTSAAYMMNDENGNSYVISIPIETDGIQLRLFYVVPEKIVNETMSGFSRQLIMTSIGVIAVFITTELMIFLYVYISRKKLFDEQISSRERMFDLLVQNTKACFGLFSVNQKEPSYVSANAKAVLGIDYIAIDRNSSGFTLRGSSSTAENIINQLNEKIRGWDGKGEFKSGYIYNDSTPTPQYFELLLYSVDSMGKDYVGIAQDVTEAYRREQTTKNALIMAEHANSAKSSFLSSMSHDIRTPMNAIINMTDFALESMNEPEKLREHLQVIARSSEHLLHIINDVLDMSRIESGQAVIENAPFNIIEELQRQVDIAAPLCAAKNQTFITDFSSVRTHDVLGDKTKFTQIILNLLSNAVKFTPENGEVSFTAEEVNSLRDDIADICFTVRDNGIGISELDIKHIFEPFSRAEDKRVNEIEGTGLGLSICRNYVSAMGGTMECESVQDEGSVFTVYLFFGKAQSVSVINPAINERRLHEIMNEKPFDGKHCLLCEDNINNQKIAVTMLKRLHFTVDIAGDGEEGIRKFMQAPENFYDIIFMDIQMPICDGYEAARAIRTSGLSGASEIPIIAMTANVFAEDVEKAHIAGMDGYLGKPITMLRLFEETYKCIHGKDSLI